MQHITISYAGTSYAWAAWISDQLALQQHSVSMHRWAPPAGAPLEDGYRELLQGAEQVVLLLDDWSFTQGGHSEPEWTQALREVVVPRLDSVTVVNVASHELSQGTAELRPVGLRNLDEPEARRRLFTALGLDTKAIVTVTADGDPPRRRCPNTPPAVSNAPRRNGRFTGRERHLEMLHDHFISAVPGAAVVALRGAQGVGKTQIAHEYIHRFGNEYDVVWYVNAETRGLARQEFARLAERLGLQAGQEVGEQIRAAHEALRTGEPFGNWLVVLDGAEQVDGLDELIPQGKGHVLLTTRSGKWSEHAELVEVDHFSRTESVDYVKRRSKRLTGQEAARLAEELEDVPLLLDHSAAWLAQNPLTSVSEYLELLRQGEFPAKADPDYPVTLDRAWVVTFNNLYEGEPASYQLLCLLAYFAPVSIPVRLLRTARRDDLSGALGELLTDPGSWTAALRTLYERGIIRFEFDDQPEHGDTLMVRNVRMHRLHQRLVKQNMSEEERRAAAATASRVLAAADPREPGDSANWTRYDELIPHLEPSEAIVSDDPSVHDFVLYCIDYLKMRGEYRTGWELCREFVRHLRTRLEPTDRTLLIAEHQHANLLRRMGRYVDAVEVGRQIVEWLRADSQTHPTDLLRAEDGLAAGLMALGKYKEAHDMFAREVETAAAELAPAAPGERSVHTSSPAQTLAGRYQSARSNLGISQCLLGRYEEAMTTHRLVLEERRRQLGDRHPGQLYYALRYAWTLRLLGRYDEAQSVQTLNARLHAQVLDKHHEQTLHAEHNLALCLRRTGEAGQAEALLRAVLRRTARKLGQHHPETLMVQSDYAMMLRQHGDRAEAGRLAQRALAGYRGLLGDEHPYTIGVFGNYGLTLWHGADLSRARTIAEETWQRMLQAVGEYHPWTLGCALNVVTARHLTDDDENAVSLARALLSPAAEVPGEGHPLTLNIRSALARCLHAQGESRAADQEYKRSIALAAGTYGDEHAYTLSIRNRVLPYWDFEPQPI